MLAGHFDFPTTFWCTHLLFTLWTFKITISSIFTFEEIFHTSKPLNKFLIFIASRINLFRTKTIKNQHESSNCKYIYNVKRNGKIWSIAVSKYSPMILPLSMILLIENFGSFTHIFTIIFRCCHLFRTTATLFLFD